MPASGALQRALLLILSVCAAIALPRGAAAEVASCPAGPGGAACQEDAPAQELMMLQVASTRKFKKQLSTKKSEACTCACAEAAASRDTLVAATGDDPCACPCELGYCTAVADPHFGSFDGYHKDWRKSMWPDRENGGQKRPQVVYRLVKTDTFEIQGLSSGQGGWVSGFAVGGDFLDGHSLVMIMKGTQKIGKMDGADVLLDGKKILESEGSEETIPGVLDATFRSGMSDAQIMETVMKDLPEFAKGEKEGADYMKVKNGIKGKHWHFKLPGRVEIFADNRYLLVKMPKLPNVRGWCGNFNGDPEDDYTGNRGSPEEKAAGGFDIIDVDDSSSGFKDAMELIQLAAAEDKEPADEEETADEEEPADEEETADEEEPADEEEGEEEGQGKDGSSSEAAGSSSLPGACGTSAKKEAAARKACSKISQPDKREECVFDVCQTGDKKVWKAYMVAEVEEAMNARGIPEFMGHGRCVDSEKRTYTTLAATGAGVGTVEGCRGVLKALASVDGVRGAQLSGKACQILVDPKHGDIKTYKKVSDGDGELIVEDTDGADGFTCWKIN